MNLPDKPSDLIELALSDLRKCEADPRYAISMGDWHTPDGGVCEVCFAGAVLAKSLGAKPEDYMSISEAYVADRQTRQQLRALDSFRSGRVRRAFEFLDATEPDDMAPSCDIEYYGDDPDKFKRQMHRLAEELRAGGS